MSELQKWKCRRLARNREGQERCLPPGQPNHSPTHPLTHSHPPERISSDQSLCTHFLRIYFTKTASCQLATLWVRVGEWVRVGCRIGAGKLSCAPWHPREPTAGTGTGAAGSAAGAAGAPGAAGAAGARRWLRWASGAQIRLHCAAGRLRWILVHPRTSPVPQASYAYALVVGYDGA